MKTIRTFISAVRRTIKRVQARFAVWAFRKEMRASEKFARKLDRRLARTLKEPRSTRYSWNLYALNAKKTPTWAGFKENYEIDVVAITVVHDVVIAAAPTLTFFKQNFRFWLSPELSQTLHPSLIEELQEEYAEALKAHRKKAIETLSGASFSECIWGGQLFTSRKQFDRLIEEERLDTALEEAP